MKAHKQNFNLLRVLLFSSFLIAVIFIRYHMRGVNVTQASSTKFLAQRATITTAPSPTVVLTAPTNLNVICPIPGKVTYTWNPVPGAANYRFANNPIAQGSTPVFTNSTQTNIAPGSTVNWYVAAERNGELGPESHGTATCPRVPPPTQIDYTCSGATATLSWYPGSGIYGSGGTLRDITANASFSTFGQPNLSSTSFNVPAGHQIGGTLYNYIVIGNTNYYSSNVTVPNITCPKPVALTAPTGLTASCPAPGSKVTYKWNAVAGADSYMIANNPTAQGGTYVTNPTYTTDSAPGSTMKFYVVAVNGAKVGPESSGSVTCAPVPPPTAIQNSCSGVTGTTSWTPGTGIYGSGGQFTDVTTGKVLSQWGQPGINLARINVPNNDVISGYVYNYVSVSNTYYYSTKVTIPQYTCPNLSPTPDPTKCSTDADCTCGKLNNSCAFVNKQYSQGICTTPDFCTGISGRCGPKCVSGSCAMSCPSTTITPTPTPSENTSCVCNSNNSCDASCSFTKYSSSDISNVNYSNPIGCSLASVPFSSTATQTNKNQWCQRNLRTKGDATGDGKVDDLDYFYYVQAVSGGTMPIDSSKSLNVNPDFNGNGSVGTDDRIIVIHSLQSGL